MIYKFWKKTVALLIVLIFFTTAISVNARNVNKKIENTNSTFGASIDVEKFVWDPNTQMWADADTFDTAIEIKKNEEATFKIVIYNDGNEVLTNIGVHDLMHKSFSYINSDPIADDYFYDEPFHNLLWVFPGPLQPTEIIELYITAEVLGPVNSNNNNYVEVIATGGGTNVVDDDYVFIKAIEKSRNINMHLLEILQHFQQNHQVLSLLLKFLL